MFNSRYVYQMKDIQPCTLQQLYFPMLAPGGGYPGPRGFSWFFTACESCERAVNWQTWVPKQQERKTSGYLGLESHFHADARVRIWPSSSDWLILLQNTHSNKYDWPIWLAILSGQWGYLLLHFLCVYLYQGKNLLAKYCISQFI